MATVCSIASTLKVLRRDTPQAMLDEADEIGTMLTDGSARYTPVGHEVDPETGEDTGVESGKLKRSWERVPARRLGPDRYETGTRNPVSYADFVRRGTRAHIIRPRADRRAGGRPAALRFWSRGEIAFRKEVHHPGTRGHWMPEKAAEDAQREWPQRADARFQILARNAEIRGEQSAERHQ